MRSLRAILLVLPMLAFAGWRSVGSVTPSVVDVQVVDAGVVLAVSSASGAIAWQVTDAGVTTINTLTGSFVGGGFYAPNCLLGLTNLGNIVATTGCGPGTALGSSNWRSFKLLSSPPRAVALLGTPASVWAGPGANTGWSTPTPGLGGLTATDSMQTREINGIDYTAVNTGFALRIAVDGGPASSVANTLNWRDAVPFPLAGRPAVLGVLPTALVLIPDYRTPVNSAPSIPPGLAPRYAAMSRFTGMVTTSTVLLAPIPNPNRIAETWVVRPGPTGETLSDKIHCLDDRSCATANAAGVVWLYSNDLAPTVSAVVPQFDAGQTVRLSADAGDGDGDPIYLSWDAGPGVIWSSVAGVNDGTQIDLTVPSGVCLPSLIEVTVTDGLPSHERTIQVPLTVIDRGEVQLNVPVQPVASGPAVSVGAFVDGGCASASFSWSASDGQTGTGSTFNWVPPLTECNVDGGQVTITTTATWLSGTPATTSANVTLTVVPWGTPAAPAFASPGSQRSGEQVDWLSSGSEHACSTSNRFPGTTLEWTYDAGATVVTEIDGGLHIDAPRCARFPTRVVGSAIRRVSGEMFGRQSAPGSLIVDIIPDAPPLTASSDFSITVLGDAGVLFGTLSLDAGCQDERGVEAWLSVVTAGSVVVDGGFRPLDGSWRLRTPGGCSGGTFDVFAELYEDGGRTGATDQGTVTLPFTPVVIGEQSITRIDVACGAGARGTVSLIPEPNACGAADIVWRATSGPALIVRSGTGDTLELQTEALDFSVVGQQITLEWAADAGAGNGDVVSRSIELSVQPFLEVSVKPHPPLRREEEAVALEVRLQNTTACAVEGLSVTLPLSGGSPIPESVLLENVRTPARLTDEGLVVDGVSVPAGGYATIQVSARARLLSSPTVQPVASLNGYVVSTMPPVTQATGCGCSQVEVSALFGALLLLCRRRRSS